MAKLILCDKCGYLQRPEETRPVEIFFCHMDGLADQNYEIHWQNKDVKKSIRQDLCAKCWSEFVDDAYGYFNIKK